MKILAPISSVCEVETLLKAGADEFYAGITPEVWRRKFGMDASLNCHPPGLANFSSYEELGKAIEKIHNASRKIFIVFNTPYFTSDQVLFADKILDRVTSLGPDALILSNPGLILHIKDKYPDIELHLSVQTGIFNSQAVRFFEKIGVRRVVLPEHLPIDMIKGIIDNSPEGIDFELFVKNNLCRNLESFCSFSHWQKKRSLRTSFLIRKLNSFGYSMVGMLPEKLKKAMLNSPLIDPFLKKHGCNITYKVSGYPDSEKLSRKDRRSLREYTSYYSFFIRHKSACGVCGIYRASESGVKVFKIDGRHMPLQMKESDVRFIKLALDALEQAADEEEYCSLVKGLGKNFYGSECSSQKCYFPDMRP